MKRSRINLSNTHLTTAEMGKLIPFEWYDCLPGDVARLGTNITLKMQPTIAPLMHRINMLTQYYFVPYRILWDNWSEFITGGEDGNATPTVPTMKAPVEKGVQQNTLFDYFGIPINKPELEFSAMLARAYTKIWNDHYKTDDIEAELPISTDDGLDTTTNIELLNCNWARDRFTRAKPFTQRGAQIAVPIQPAIVDNYAYPVTLKNITQNGDSTQTKPTTDYNEIGTITYSGIPTEAPAEFDISSLPTTFTMTAQPSETLKNYVVLNYYGSIIYIPVSFSQGDILSYSDNPLSNPKSISMHYKWNTDTRIITITGLTAQIESTSLNKISVGKIGSLNIRDLRVASSLQRFQERSLKYGAEYEDYCRQEFGVRPRDSRLQKSEYLGGSQGILQISEVLQTAQDADSPLGAVAGYAVGKVQQRRIKYFCPEHGIIIGIMSIRPETIYTDGLDRALLKKERWDYWTRELVGIGAQEIKTQEIFATKDNQNDVFGYDLNGNYREYYSKNSRVSGNFRTDLNFWHLARMFNEAPVLNSSFLKMNPRKDVLAITDQTLPAFLCYCQNSAIFYRPIPKKVKNILK